MKNIQDILKAHAAYDKEIGYVQGINYVAGFLYSILKDTEKTFQYLAIIMQKHLKVSIYSNFQKLKSYCSRFDQILDLYKPKLSVHFQVSLVLSIVYSNHNYRMKN